MNSFRRPGLQDGLAMSWLGWLLAQACALSQLGSVWFVRPDAAALWTVLVCAGTLSLLSTLLAVTVPWERGARELLMAYPVLFVLECYALTLADNELGTAYLSLPLVAFLFCGLTQRRALSVTIVPLAALNWITVQRAHLTGGQLHVRLVLSVVVDVLLAEVQAAVMSEHRKVHVKLRSSAMSDSLTGLGNRRALDAATDNNADVSVILLDLDHFKRVNDSRGHLEGDRVLQDFGHVVTAVLRLGDSGFRYGGEEFLVLAPNADLDGADQILARIRMAWAALHHDITFSAGVALLKAGDPLFEVIGRADEALYRAKAAGRDCTRVAVRPPHLEHLAVEQLVA